MRSEVENRKVQDLEWEVLPPEGKQSGFDLEQLFHWLARVMDELFRLPGTKFRFGLDPLIGLVPGIGDTASALVSVMALVTATRRGLPKLLLLRMSLNILINEAVGVVPVLGDAFSFWFKSNLRNYELLRRHAAAPRAARKSDWIFIGVVLTLLAFFVLAGIAIGFWLLSGIFHLLGGR